jgi:hypothetical protein
MEKISPFFTKKSLGGSPTEPFHVGLIHKPSAVKALGDLAAGQSNAKMTIFSPDRSS